jgi:hypothetical protein
MQWSKLKTRVKELMVPSLRRRIDFHVTSYRQSHDEAEKAWVTIDGETVFTASWYRHQWAGALRTKKGTLAQDGRGQLLRDPAVPEFVTTAEQIELHRPQDFGESLRRYLDLSLPDALSDQDPFVRGLALVDRRLGRARFSKIGLGQDEHSFVKLMYELRSAEFRN